MYRKIIFKEILDCYLVKTDGQRLLGIIEKQIKYVFIPEPKMELEYEDMFIISKKLFDLDKNAKKLLDINKIKM